MSQSKVSRSIISHTIRAALPNIGKGGLALLSKLCILGILSAIGNLLTVQGLNALGLLTEGLWGYCSSALLILLTAPLYLSLVQHHIHGVPLTYNLFQGMQSKAARHLVTWLMVINTVFYLENILVSLASYIGFETSVWDLMNSPTSACLLALWLLVKGYIALRGSYALTGIAAGKVFRRFKEIWSFTSGTAPSIFALTLITSIPMILIFTLSVIFIPSALPSLGHFSDLATVSDPSVRIENLFPQISAHYLGMSSELSSMGAYVLCMTLLSIATLPMYVVGIYFYKLCAIEKHSPRLITVEAVKLAYRGLWRSGPKPLIKLCTLGILTALFSFVAIQETSTAFLLFFVIFFLLFTPFTTILMRHAVYGTAFSYNPFQGWGYKDTWRALGIYAIVWIVITLIMELILYLSGDSLSMLIITGTICVYLALRLSYLYTAMILGKRFGGIRAAWAFTRRTALSMFLFSLLFFLPLAATAGLGLVIQSMYTGSLGGLLLLMAWSMLLHIVVGPAVASFGYFYRLREIESFPQIIDVKAENIIEGENVPTQS